MVTEVSAPDCSIQRTLDQIGDRWTFLVLRDLFRGQRKFGELQTDLGIARNLLTARLNKLVDNDIVAKVAYQERPMRYEYRLTSKGRDLSPALIALMHWGDHWCAGDLPPTVLVHRDCGATLDLTVTCPSCDSSIAAADIGSTPGPGVHNPEKTTP